MSGQEPSKVRRLAGAIALGLLSACEAFTDTGPNPQARPSDLDTSARVQEPSAQSIELQQHYARLQRNFQTRGLSRTDGGGFDTPYTDADVARNFERIAFYDEFEVGQGLKRASGEPGRLAKWTGPVRISVEFGDHTTQQQREMIPGLVSNYARRLSRVTGHPISTDTARANMHVLVAGIDDKDATIARFRELEPNLSEASLNIVRNLNRKTLCFVVTFSEPSSESKIYKGIVLIRSELPDLMVQGCVHEELAQGLGLRNDSAQARPSIFNDDEEFALLTSHDEELLRLLYHPTLKPGMTLNQARPLIKRILEGNPGQI